MKYIKPFDEFLKSEKASGIILIFCTVLSLVLANSPWKDANVQVWSFQLGDHSITYWINDALMTVFFLLIGLELQREFAVGELSDFKKASLPIVAAIGGMLVPATLFLCFNIGTVTQSGAGIPMATDIAFAIGILSLVGKKIPKTLIIILTALAVVDDLGAILVIALFYTNTLVPLNLFIALFIFWLLFLFKCFHVHHFLPYIIGGIVMWYFFQQSGIHPTITGVLLAFTIPFKRKKQPSLSATLQHHLHRPVAFIVLPLFALANTYITIPDTWAKGLTENHSLGIFAGLLIGKPLGIVLFSFVAVAFRFCALPQGITWKHFTGIALLGGIGFTMSIFITLLAFTNDATITESKIAILISSFLAGVFGYVWLQKVAVRNN